MKHTITLLTALLVAPLAALTVASAPIPLHSADAPIIEKLAKHNGLDAAPEVNPTKGWPALKGELSVRFAATDGKKVLLVGHAFDGQGVAALAKVKSLRIAQIGHSKVTDAGVAHFGNLEIESGEVLRE